MKLFTKTIHDKLLENGKKQAAVRGTDEEIDFKPVVKLFTPDASCTWLLSEIDPDDPDIAFGLCDLGMGYPELGTCAHFGTHATAWSNELAGRARSWL